MGKQEKIRSLTWKYFIQQKAREVSKPIIYFLLGIIIPFALSLICIRDWGWVISLEGPFFAQLILIWLSFAIVSIFLIGIGIAIFRVIKDCFNWIKSNWKKAKAKAKKEVNKKSEKKK